MASRTLPGRFSLTAAPRPAAPAAWAIKPPSKPTVAVWFVYLMWFITLCDPQWFIASMTADIVLKMPTPLYGIMLLLVLFKLPRSWFPPFLAFILYTVVLIGPSLNRGYAIGVAKILVAFYVLAIGTLALLRSIPLSVPIVAAHMMYSYIWWVGFGVASGKVSWHHSVSNYDGYGPLMVIGIGSCYYFGQATKLKKERYLAYLTCMGCIVGMVSAFARGAVLAGGVVMVWMWLRSRHKIRTTVTGMVAIIALVIAGSLVKSRSEQGLGFFQEMATIANADNADATRGDRRALWSMATRVFYDHPILGVGANNFGPYAAQRFSAGEAEGAYNDNPATLYDRQLHSTYYQLLCEYGIVGSSIFLWMLWDFFARNRALRRRSFRASWTERSGGRLELHELSLGLECAMIAFLTSGFFYNQIFNIHWFYSIIAINTLLFYHAKPTGKAAGWRTSGATTA